MGSSRGPWTSLRRLGVASGMVVASAIVVAGASATSSTTRPAVRDMATIPPRGDIESVRPNYWWATDALDIIDPESLAWLAVLTDTSDDQFDAWLRIIDAHAQREAMELAAAAATGWMPTWFLRDAPIESSRAEIRLLRRRADLATSLIALRHELLVSLATTLTIDQQTALDDRSGLLLASPQFGGSLLIDPHLNVELAVLDAARSRSDARAAAEVVGRTVERRRRAIEYVGLERGGFVAVSLEFLLDAAEEAIRSGTTDPHDAWTVAEAKRDARRPTIERSMAAASIDYERVALATIGTLIEHGMTPEVWLEAQARLLDRGHFSGDGPTQARLLCGVSRFLDEHPHDAARDRLISTGTEFTERLIAHVNADRFDPAEADAIEAIQTRLASLLAQLGGAAHDLPDRRIDVRGAVPRAETKWSRTPRTEMLEHAATRLAPRLGWTPEDTRRITRTAVATGPYSIDDVVTLPPSADPAASELLRWLIAWERTLLSEEIRFRYTGGKPIAVEVLASGAPIDDDLLAMLIAYEQARVTALRRGDDRMNSERDVSRLERTTLDALRPALAGAWSAARDRLLRRRYPWLVVRHHRVLEAAADASARGAIDFERERAITRASEEARDAALWVNGARMLGGRLRAGDSLYVGTPECAAYEAARRRFDALALSIDVSEAHRRLTERLDD